MAQTSLATVAHLASGFPVPLIGALGVPMRERPVGSWEAALSPYGGRMRSFGEEFDVGPGYLNTPSIGVPPRIVVEAVRASVDAWAIGGAAAPDFDPAVETARSAFASLVGVPVQSVAIGDVVSSMLGRVAASLPQGTRVLTAAREFSSVSFPFAAQGHEVVEAPLAALPEQAASFDVVAVSVVASVDGALVDLHALRAGRGDALVVLDATQSLGWLPAELEWADVVVAGGYKWLLSPRGATWMAVSDRLLERVVPAAAGWYAASSRWDDIYGLPLRLASGARRLDVSPAWLAHVGAAVALPWLASLDRAAVRDHDVGLANRVRAGLDMPVGDSAILTLRRGDAAERLAARGVTASVRDGAARVGFHLHNTVDDADMVIEAMSGRGRHS
jgi:selenocysteine lyase/cysteine desulfurase